MQALVYDYENVTPSDTTAVNFEGLYVGTAGNVKVESIDGSQVTFYNIVSGRFLPIVVRKVLEATSATNIIGLKVQG